MKKIFKSKEAKASEAFNAAVELEQQNQIADSIEKLTEAINLVPSPPLYNKRGNAFSALQNHTAAVADYTTVLEMGVVNDVVLSNRADSLYELGRFEEAIHDFTESLRLGPGNVDAISGRGRCNIKLARWAAALADLNEAIRLERPQRAAPLIKARGDCYFGMQRWDLAKRDYEHALTRDRNYSEARCSLATANLRLKQYAMAIQIYGHVISAPPSSLSPPPRQMLNCYLGRAEAFLHTHQYARALEDLYRAEKLSLSSENTADGMELPACAYTDRADCHFALQHFVEAIVDYSHSIAREPTNATVHYKRALSQIQLQRYEHAIDDLTRSIDCDPHTAIVYCRRGDCFVNMANAVAASAEYDTEAEEVNLLNAASDYEQFLDLATTDPTLDRTIVFSKIGAVLYRLQRYDEAIAKLTRAIDNSTKAHLETLTYRGDCYHAKSMYDEALRDYTDVISSDPSYVNAYIHRGLVFQTLQQFHRAIDDYTKVITLCASASRGLFDAYLRRGHCYKSLNMYDQAVSDFLKAQEFSERPSCTALLACAQTYLDMHSYEKCLDVLSKCIEINRTDARTHYYQSLLLSHVHRYKEALSSIDECMELLKSNTTTKNYRKHVFESLDDVVQMSSALQHKAWVLCHLGMSVEAIAIAAAAIESASSSASAYYIAGHCYFREGRHLDASNAFNSALSCDPNHVPSLVSRSLCHPLGFSIPVCVHTDSTVGHSYDSDSDLAKAMRIDCILALTTRADFLMQWKRYGEALIDYTIAIERNSSTNPMLSLSRGECYFHTEQFAEALEDMISCLSLYPSCSIAQQWKARCVTQITKLTSSQATSFNNGITSIDSDQYDISTYEVIQASNSQPFQQPSSPSSPPSPLVSPLPPPPPPPQQTTCSSPNITETASSLIQTRGFLEILPNELSGPKECIGTGGLGAVYKWTWLGDDVCVKMINPGMLSDTATDNAQANLSDDSAIGRIISEVQVMSSIQSARCLRLYGAYLKPFTGSRQFTATDIHEDAPYLVTEYMAGGSLHDLLHKHQVQLTIQQIQRIAIDILYGLSYLHTREPRIIHRDIKTASVLLDRVHGDARAKIAELGFSRPVINDVVLSTAVETPYSMAPEVLKGAPYTEKTDMWSFAMVLFEMVTNRIPHLGGENSVYKIRSELRVRPLLEELECQPAVETKTSVFGPLIDCCWDSDPNKRPSAADALQQLKELEATASPLKS